MARTARQILARYCPTPHSFRLSDDDDADPEFFVPYDDAIKAIQDATGEEAQGSDLTPIKGFLLVIVTIVTSPVIMAIVGAGAVIDRCDQIMRRVKFGVR